MIVSRSKIYADCSTVQMALGSKLSPFGQRPRDHLELIFAVRRSKPPLLAFSFTSARARRFQSSWGQCPKRWTVGSRHSREDGGFCLVRADPAVSPAHRQRLAVVPSQPAPAWLMPRGDRSYTRLPRNLQARGAVEWSDKDKPIRASTDIAKCDTALTKLGATRDVRSQKH